MKLSGGLPDAVVLLELFGVQEEYRIQEDSCYAIQMMT